MHDHNRWAPTENMGRRSKWQAPGLLRTRPMASISR